MAYVYWDFKSLKPMNHTDIVDHLNVLFITLQGPVGPFNLVNIYSEFCKAMGLAILKACCGSLPEIGYMGGDFNCPSSLWNDTVMQPLPKAVHLQIFTKSLGLEVRLGPDQSPTHFSYSGAHSLVIDLVFLRIENRGASVRISDRDSSDHCSIMTTIQYGFNFKIGPDWIKPGLKEEFEFLELIADCLATITIPALGSEIQSVVMRVAEVVAALWSLTAKASRMCKRSKTWWTADCSHAKCIALKVNTKDNWITLNKVTCRAKQQFFEKCISEIAEKTKRPWDLMDWIAPRKLPSMKAITVNR